MSDYGIQIRDENGKSTYHPNANTMHVVYRQDLLVNAYGYPDKTWVKYATSSTGTGITSDPTGMTYIGFVFNSTADLAPTTPNSYSWVLVTASIWSSPTGLGTYTWVKYATSVNGTGINDSPTGMTYIGLRYSNVGNIKSTNPDSYRWALIGEPVDGIHSIPGWKVPILGAGTTCFVDVRSRASRQGTGILLSIGLHENGTGLGALSPDDKTTFSFWKGRYNWTYGNMGLISSYVLIKAAKNIAVFNDTVLIAYQKGGV